MNHAHLITRILLGIAILFAGGATASAQVEAPGKPIEFYAKVVENGTAKLSWMANRDGGDPTSFCIFYAEGETENMDDFELLKETDIRADQNGVYTYLVKDLDPGKYTFYIVAKNEGGDSPRSVTKVLTLEEEDNDGVPGKPVEFSAKAIRDGAAASIRWQENRDGGKATSFCIYYAEGETENMDHFELLADIEAKPNTAVYEYSTDDLDPGVYSFYVVAKNEDGKSQRSIIKVVNLKDPEAPRIWIVSKPVKEGHVGREWTYQLRIESNFKGSGTTYILKEGPEGMTINAETGKVSWPEPVEGRYEIKICVEVEYEGRIIVEEQIFVLEIGGGDGKEECAVFLGSVNADDATGRPILEGKVTAWLIRDANTPDGGRKVFTAEIREGRYEMTVPAGTYKLFVEGSGFHKEWYEDATNADDANLVLIQCQTEREVNFLVGAKEQPVMRRLSGRVFDAETEEPIYNAIIYFDYAGDRGEKPKGNLKRIVTESNQNGHYEVELPDGVPYIAHAVARTPNAGRDSYLVEWWENTHDATLASRIVLDGSREGLNFPMDKKTDVEGGFSGKMMDDASEEGVIGTVVAYQVGGPRGGDPEGKRRIESVETNEKGQYEFRGLPSGEYIILGIPAERPFVPGWHVSQGIAADSWKDATHIVVKDAMDATPYNIRLEMLVEGIGRGEARGWVYDKRTGHIKADVGEVQETVGIPGAVVYAYDADMNIVDYTIAGEEGEYVLTTLGIGTTSIMADRINFVPESETVILTTEELTASISIGLQPLVTSVEVPVYEVGLNGRYNLYPNPANGQATISFPSTMGTATVRIVSSAGVVLSTESISTTQGSTAVQISTASLPAGMVMIHVTSGTQTFALPLSVMR